jgi:general secretion pathway protein N
MTRAETMRRPAIGLTLLLVTALGVAASTSARPSDMSDLDADAPRHIDALSESSLPESKPAEPLPASLGQASGANPLWAIPLAALSNTRERPIFSPSRRPPPPVAAPVPVAKAPPPPKPAPVERAQLSLVGTIIGGDQSFGIFIDPSTNAALRLKIGEDFQGWTLRSVQGREATLERDQQITLLSLPPPGAGATGQLRAESVVVPVPADPPLQRGDRH